MTILEWLLDSDPAIRWQVLRDLLDAPAKVVAKERARTATEGWGARLLALQGEDGQWAGGACFPSPSLHAWTGIEGQPWISTLPTLQLLYDFGVDPSSERVCSAVAQVRDHCRWEHAGQSFFSGEVEPCINGRTVALGAYFGQNVDSIVARLLGEQLEDGGWNCEAENGSVRSSFATTINVLEGLLAHERITGGSPNAIAARLRGEEYLLERKLLRRKSTGEVVNPSWLQFSFPVRWHYDVMRALDYFRLARDMPDPRMGEAIDLLRRKQQPGGTWLLENTHPGAVHFTLERGDGEPSRWNTLRALRILRWYESASSEKGSASSAALVMTDNESGELAMFTPKGQFGWYELMTSDTAAAGKFYSEVIGWTTEKVSETYTTFNLGGVGVAGMLHIQGHTSWIGYIAVDDVDAHIEKIVEAGGKLLKPATDVPGMLRFAVMSDPQDAAFVVFTPNPAMPSPARPTPSAAGSIGWRELYTTDLEAGFAFYNSLFGWGKVSDVDLGPHGVYRIFDEGGHEHTGTGGMMTKAPQIPASVWNFYITVDSVKATGERVQSGGGKIINGPVQALKGIWIIQALDPQGAMFCLISNKE